MSESPSDRSDRAEQTFAPLLCHRCGCTLRAGEGSHYVVRIEAFADPTPPVLDEGDGFIDTNSEIADLLDEMKDMSERELMDQVYRRLTLHLCRPCYQIWIEDPAR
jgi:hypothetical protein